MIKTRSFAGLLFLFLFALSPIVLAQSSNSGIADQVALVTEFDVNGLKVLVKRRASAPTVAAGLFIRGGARNINKENAGIESFMLNVAGEASRKYSRAVVRRELARTGSSVSAGSNNDYSVFSLASTRQNFARSWDIYTDLIINPTFANADVNRIRDGIVTGLRERESNADNFLQILQDRIIYAKHPYENDVNGSIETLNSFTAADLRNYHKKIMKTSRLLLVVVGDVDAEDLKSRVAAKLGKLPRGNYKEASFPALDFSKPTLNVTTRSLPTNYVQGVFDAPPLSSPDYSAMRVAITALQSRVFQEVRVKRQLSYAPNAGLKSLSSNTANSYVTAVDANQAVSVMLQEISRLKTTPLRPQIISRLSGHFLTVYYLNQQTNGAQVAELAKYELIGGGWRNAFEFLKLLRGVSSEDVQNVSQKYMKNIRFVVVGNPQAIEKDIFLQQTD
ncbi:MAG: insulinase family protein [Pyrinomonadaceae bacterium]|nr:insulinase family protein [Pyrinomonadaceae bacterium]